MDEAFYFEKIRSNLTTVLFLDLFLIFLFLSGWRFGVVGWKFTPILFLVLSGFFLFYVFNYRTLKVQITEETLILRFGLVRWRTPLSNIQSCALDESPWWIKYGGAGVHFVLAKGIYRAYFNFLEGPRILVVFKEKQGLVQALSFSTRQPEVVLELLGKGITS